MMKYLKRIVLTLLAAILVVSGCILKTENAEAASKKPGKPVISIEAGSDGVSAVITIEKTKRAAGYQIFVKKPGTAKFVKLAAVKQDGTEKRSYTAKDLSAGDYSFKVRAYAKSGKKTIKGKYSKVVSITIEGGSADETVKYISTKEELAAIDLKSSKIRYVLKNDIDMNGWKPLEGVYCSIDGAGHTLKNLSVPFIGSLYGGKIENIIFDINITTIYQLDDYKMAAPIGFLAGGDGLNDIGTIRNCKTIGTINCVGGEGFDPYDYKDAIDVGGIVAFNPNNMGYIERCVNEASITIKGFPNAAIGGIVGVCGGGTEREVVVQCKNAGDINTDTERYTTSYCGVGGICGSQNGLAILKDCLNTGSVKVTSDGGEYPRKGAGISGAIASPIMENCVSVGASDYAIAGQKISADTVTNWSYSTVRFVNVYYADNIGSGFMWEGNPVEIQGVKAVSDITDESAFAGLDFENVWKMGENAPELRNIPYIAAEKSLPLNITGDDKADYSLTITDSTGMKWRVTGPFAQSFFDEEGSKFATSGDGWSWEESTNTLTLDGFVGKQIIARDGYEQLNIVLKGKNTITKNDGEPSDSAVCIGRTVGGNITTVIKGDGTLTIDVGTMYNYCFGGDTVIFEGSPTLICNVHDQTGIDGTAYSANTTMLGKDAMIKATCSDYAAFTSSNEGWKDPSVTDQINGILILENTNNYAAMRVYQAGQTAIGSDRVIYCGPNMQSMAAGYSNITYGNDGSFYFKDYEDANKNAKAMVICGKDDDLKDLIGYDPLPEEDIVGTVKIKSVKSPKKGQVNVTWKKVSDASGYEIYTSDSEDGDFNLAVTVNKNGKKGVIRKVKSKGVIYVKVRAYRTKDGKTLYGGFSEVKRVKVK